MKPNLKPAALAFIAALLPFAARADWKISPATEYSREIRVWDPAPELKLDFQWTGGVNERHEAHGEGILRWLNADWEEISTYEGSVKNGKREGNGVWRHRSGSRYAGEWAANVKNGKGEYWLSDGSYYIGEFRDDRMDGNGKWVSPDGSVYEGAFVAGKKHGPGTLTLPGGITHESVWDADKDTAAAPPQPTEPYVIINIDTAKYALGGQVFEDGGGGECLTYRGRWQDGCFNIDSDWSYWQLWSDGGPIGSSDGESCFDVGPHPVYLDIRIFNPTKEKISVTRTEIAVDESHPDTQPILDIGDWSPDGGIECGLYNFTANPVETCELSFNILPPDSAPRFADYKFTLTLPTFTESAGFSLDESLKTFGVDVDALKAIGGDHGYEQEKMDEIAGRVKKGLGEFTRFAKDEDGYYSAHVLIAGQMKITWTDHLSAKQEKTVRFSFTKTLCLFWPERGAAGPSAGTYDVILDTNGKDYVKPVSYKHTIPPGANGRLSLKLAADASSLHRFRLRLTTADGAEILSPECRLHFLLPGSFSWKDTE